MWRDIQYALRACAKNPVFTLICVITIALGIGPNSAIFSIINAVLLRPLPYRDPDRIVMLWESIRSRGFNQIPVSAADLADWKRDSRSFEDMAPAFAIPEYGLNVTAGGDPERAQAGQAAANFFSVLGVKPLIGRSFLPEEDRPGGDPAVLVSQSFWTRRFGSSPKIIGQRIIIDGVSRNVVGVLPREMDSLVKVDLWIPIARDFALDPRDNHNFGIVARLKPGVSVAQARAELEGIAARLEKQYHGTNQGVGAVVVPMSEMLSGPIRPALMVLLSAVGFLLLIACANVASLLLARGASRSKEIAVRAAMGASRARILRQLLTESVILGAIGGVLGLLLSMWSIRVLRVQLPDFIPRLKDMGVDSRVLLFSLAVSVLTGVVFGIAPALRASRSELNETLKEGGGKGVSADSSQRARTVLLVGEVALAVVLLTGAGLLIRSFLNVTATDPGFRTDHLLTMQLTLPDAKYHEPHDLANFSKSAIRRIEALPGVHAVGAITVLPARGSLLALRVFVTGFQVEGEPSPLKGQEPTADYRPVTPDFFRTMGIPLRRGRFLDAQDGEGKRRVVLVNETLARRYLNHGDPLSRQLRVGFGSHTWDVVGIVGDIHMQGREEKVEPAIYLPMDQDPPRQFSLVVHSEADPAGLSAAIRREIQAIDPDQPIADVRMMTEVLSDSLLVRRLSVGMLATFAALALVLATVGIYGLTSYSVSRRTHEIGLRMVLGAGQQNILRLVVWRGMLTALAGVAIGLPVAFMLSRLMRALLFGVTSTDTATFAIVPLVLIGAAALASYVPARRAIRIDPMVAMRYE